MTSPNSCESYRGRGANPGLFCVRPEQFAITFGIAFPLLYTVYAPVVQHVENPAFVGIGS
jgi:hypothetical protein